MNKWQALLAAKRVAKATRSPCVVFPEMRRVPRTGRARRIIERGVGKSWGWNVLAKPSQYSSDGADRPIGVKP